MSSLSQALQSKPCTLRYKYEAFIEKTAKEIGIQEKVNLHFEDTFSALYGSKRVLDDLTKRVNAVVQLNLSFLIDPRDVPDKFLIKGLEDPRIRNEKFFRSFTAWVDSYFCTKQKKDLVHNKNERDGLILFLYQASKPELLEKNRKFTIVHEMAHLLHHHQSDREKIIDNGYACSNLLKDAALAVTAAITGTYFLTVLIPSLGSMGAFLFGVGTFAGTMYYADQSKEKKFFIKCRTQELEADAFAVNALKDKSGAEHFFKTFIAWSKKVFPDRERILYDSQPVEYRTHPTLEKRLARIEKMTLNLSFNSCCHGYTVNSTAEENCPNASTDTI